MCANQNKWKEIFHPQKQTNKVNNNIALLSLRQIEANRRTYADGYDFVFEFRSNIIMIGMYTLYVRVVEMLKNQ